MQVREKIEKSQNAAFCQWFAAPEGRKVGSRKQAGVEPSGRQWEMKNCTPLRHEAHVQVKTYKTHQRWTTFGSWDEKSARRMSKLTCTRHTMLRPLLKVEMSTKGTPFWREAQFEKSHARTTVGHSDVVLCGRYKGSYHALSQEWTKRDDSVVFHKAMAGVGRLKRICQGAFRLAEAIRETCSSGMLGGLGADFLRHLGASDLEVCWDDFVWHVQHFVWPGWHHLLVARAVL